MQVSVQVGEGLKRELRVDLSADDIEAEIDKRLQRFARTARAPGFRPGKVPVRVLRQQYGEQVRGEVFGEMVQSSFMAAVQQEDLQIAGMPSIEPDVDHKARRYTYTASFEVFPTVELKSLEGATIKRPVVEITDEDIDRMIERLRDQRTQWVEVEREARNGDRVVVSFEGSIDGEPFKGGTAENFPIELGSGHMIPGFEDQLLGASAGETRGVDLSFPEQYQAEHLAGKAAHFEVQVQTVSESQRPEVDEDFIRDIGVSSGDMTEFRDDVRTSMEQEMQQKIDEIVKSQVLDQLVENNPIDVPQPLIDQEAHAMNESYTKSAQAQQLPSLPQSFFVDTARRRVLIGLLGNEAFKHYGLSVDDEAVQAKLSQLAAGYEHPEEVIKHYMADKNLLAQLRATLVEETVVARLLEDAQVEEDPKTFFELTDTRQSGDAA
ncbi:trigger factor [Rhabdochromatium marinum]|uniref:trigger factor n=1 Tax=Rhabdochromatium marinum TaxID=48729 RepID=UPI001903B89B|nr:trigger factor [Rhabdochromatium marinum]MBK1647397.1 trigger factor [Rhabdochromatium marinum]